MAQTMKISAVEDLVVDDRVAPCPSHESIVEQPGFMNPSNLVSRSPFSLRRRRTRIHTALPAGSRLVSRS